MKSQYEIEEDDICERYNRGDITLQEYNREMRELQRDYQAEAEQAARDAYNREMENWL